MMPSQSPSHTPPELQSVLSSTKKRERSAESGRKNKSSRKKSKIKGGVGTKVFNRFLQPKPPRVKVTADQHSPRYDTTRGISFTVTRHGLGLGDQEYLADMATQPLVAGSLVYSPDGVVSSAQKKNVSPLLSGSMPQSIEHAPYVISSGWVLIPKGNSGKSRARSHSQGSRDEDVSDRENESVQANLSQSGIELVSQLLSPSDAGQTKKSKRKSYPTNKQIKGKSADTAVKAFKARHPEAERIVPALWKNDSQTNPWEWSHILGKALDRGAIATDPENLVVMSRHMNTWMLLFETVATILAKSFPELDVYIHSAVKVFEHDRDIAEYLHYRVRCYIQPDLYIELYRCFNIAADQHKFLAPRVSDKRATVEAFAKILEIVTENPGCSGKDLQESFSAITAGILEYNPETDSMELYKSAAAGGDYFDSLRNDCEGYESQGDDDFEIAEPSKRPILFTGSSSGAATSLLSSCGALREDGLQYRAPTMLSDISRALVPQTPGHEDPQRGLTRGGP